MAEGGSSTAPGEHPVEGSATAPAIVGIGASAGGVQALQTFFQALPANTGAAFVVIVHLDPRGHSELPSILAARTAMPVVQVGASEPLLPNHVYVIPPNRRLHITAHEIAAAEFDEPRGQRVPIDLFFRSLAEHHGDGFAVILTGAGSDGAVGVRAVKEAGGIILVQDPAEAEYPSMPRSAIATGMVDFVLPLRELAKRVAELARTKDRVAISEAKVNEEMLRRILALVRVRTEHDFSKYKRPTVLRRLARRMQVTRTETLDDYYDFLRDEAGEAQALLGDLLISVTTFFRDSEVFEALRKQALPQLFAEEHASDTVRAWVPGCATGEEAYTIAMLLLEEAPRHEPRAIQVFGSDVDLQALAMAREGRYPAAIEADVNEERLRRFFTREQDHFRVRRELRDTVVFASHSLLRDPPFSRMDLVSCRNLLIYLDRDLQQQVCTTLNYALVPGGFLLLGSSETADSPPGLFRTIDRKARIYQSTAETGARPRLLPQLLGAFGMGERGFERPHGRSAAQTSAGLHREALEKEAPPSMLVDTTHRIVHLSEHAGRFLQPSGGPLTADALELVRPELRLDLRTSLNRAFEQGRATLSLPIPVSFNGAAHRVFLQVKPAEQMGNEKPKHALVLFIEGEAAERLALPDQPADGNGSDETTRRLTEELALAHAQLRTTREESESANEELRAANEELQSINEEYRSTSEELETSKEELQSINEELQTVNSELKLKLDLVSRAHNDLQNLIAATDFGTLFLDPSLRVKFFTARATDIFRLTPNDQGRPITDFAHQLEYDGLAADARTAFAHLTPIRREVHSRNGRWFDIRLRPYRTAEDKVDGVVITFMDITERHQTEEALRQSERALRQEKRLLDVSREPIFVWEFDSNIIREWNRGCEELYGYTRQEALGQSKDRLFASSAAGTSFTEIKEKLRQDGTWSGELKQKTKYGRDVVVEARLQLEPLDGLQVVIESTRDITERKQWEHRQQLLLGELAHRVKNTLALVQAIAHQTMRTSASNKDFADRFEARLLALARAHGLLIESDWKGADLRALVRNQLEPYASENLERLAIEGEPVSLPADLATPVGLVFHELAANAAKYGSLSVVSGRVTVTWTLAARNHSRLLAIVWHEQGGPKVEPPTTSGFGSLLIDNGIPGATVTREFLPEGVVCTIELPLRRAFEHELVD